MTSRRKSLLLSLPWLIGSFGCVVPAGPNWKDPQGNYPPAISQETPPVPPIGSVLAMNGDAGAVQAFEVVLRDQNTQDKLYGRWIIDYPPFVPGQSHTALTFRKPGGNEVERSPELYAPSCSDDHITRDFSNHRLLLAVSDRPFASDDPDDPGVGAPDAVPPGNFLLEASWGFALDCQ